MIHAVFASDLFGMSIVFVLFVVVPLLLVAALISMFREAGGQHTVFGGIVFVMLALVLLLATLIVAIAEISRYITLYMKEIRANAVVFKQDKHIDGVSCDSSIVFMDRKTKTYVFSPGDLPDALKSNKAVVHVRRRVKGPCGGKEVVIAYDKGRPEAAEILSFPYGSMLYFLGELAVLGIWGRVSRKRKAAA
jgi:hypothetical protein